MQLLAHHRCCKIAVSTFTLREYDLNIRPLGHEPNELPTAPSRIIKGKGEKVKEKRNNQEATHHESFPYLMYIVYYKILFLSNFILTEELR